MGNIQRPANGFVKIEVVAKDRNGLIYDIVGTMYRLQIDILRHEARVCGNKEQGMISKSRYDIVVKNEEQLAMLRQRLHRIKGIISVQ
jgi:(p)ppGpp synthase/HD superfamily hydrolase